MESVNIESIAADPVVPDWSRINLPKAWPDLLQLNTPQDRKKLFKLLFSSRQRVRLPEDMPGANGVPNYMLQEFHHLPNGYYSEQFTKGYSIWFDRVMLGHMKKARTRVSRELNSCASVLDVGCGHGALAATLKREGRADVWGIDPSPYLLKLAAASHPDIPFILGTAENTGFSDNRFDGIAISFLLHEIPPKYADLALQEFHRILKPGGLIAITEPSPKQMYSSWLRMLFEFGVEGVYFKWFANRVYEPFVDAWHKKEILEWFRAFGFELLQDSDAMPVRYIVVRKL
ncbi:type 11 methyltransferase [Oleiphilus messinensis]|uniref:Type 11 methyltransferase n=1 Tax=Oleiphilus messinensis TaxID=141451 RepID=A0A1Y0IFT2_9GAMM|nr:class I SAM-dependent methyltransferase [Oleiphilus messinensis]ARU58234.1 type 11 methyltransferase [Oleiphilus messinensis]